MRLRELELMNFRCFERLKVPLLQEVTVFVGNNASGKTAILDGIAYGLSRILTRLPGVAGKDIRSSDIQLGRRWGESGPKILEAMKIEDGDAFGELARPLLASPARAALDAVRNAIVEVIPQRSHPRVLSKPPRMVVTWTAPDGTASELSLQMLSDGYRTMLALVMDFARRLAQANPHLPKPTEAEAILMVDEIDLHLRPIWQQTVIPSFRRAFPNTQLILSTHSPQVLTTVDSKGIWIVQEGGIQPCPAPTFGARSSDVVSEVLGLESLRPPNNKIAERIRKLFQALDLGRLGEARAHLRVVGGFSGLPATRHDDGVSP